MGVTIRILVFVWLAVVVCFVTILSFIVCFQATRPVMVRSDFSLSPANFSYKIYTEKKSWKHAKLSCYGIQAKLVEVDTQEQQTKLRNFIRENGTPKDELSGYWMGGRKKTKWTWVSTGADIYERFFSGWHFRKPDNSVSENGQTKDCMEMQWINTGRAFESLSWNNILCKEERQYICQGFYLNQKQK